MKFDPTLLSSILKENNPQDLEVSLEEIDNFGDNQSMTEAFYNIANYTKMLKESIMFVNDDLTTAVPFTRENLYLICGYSGNGKSTLAANISYPLWKQCKKTLVIANEEPKQDILFRIGCLELGYEFNDYKKGRMPECQRIEVAKLFPDIAKYVKILDVNYKNGLTMKVEGVKKALESVKNADYSCVMIDYFQLIKFSVEKPFAKSYDVLNDFQIWLGRYIKEAKMPVVVFAQLHSLGKRNNKDLDSRIKHCPDIYQPATVVLEIIPDFEERTTKILIVKDRFGLAGTKITCGFDKGRFVNMTSEFQNKIIQNKLDKLTQSVEVTDNEIQ